MNTEGRLAGLSSRAENCCFNAGWSTREDVMGAATSGALLTALKTHRNFGWKTYEDILNWLNLPVPNLLHVWPHAERKNSPKAGRDYTYDEVKGMLCEACKLGLNSTCAIDGEGDWYHTVNGQRVECTAKDWRNKAHH